MSPAVVDGQLIELCLREDLGEPGDVTAALIPETSAASARIIAREAGVICGIPWAEALFARLDERVQCQWLLSDGERCEAGQTLARLHGPTRSLVTGERCALNILQMLSGTATQTARYVQALGSLDHVLLLDTRKTIPLWRQAQKYAVRCGGGHSHRSGLYDAMLVKENHIAAFPTLTEAVQAALAVASRHPALSFVSLEVESLAQLAQAAELGLQRVLLDNFDLDMLKEAVAAFAGKLFLEASGNITLENIAQVAQTGVDAISTGALTKHVRALDLSCLLGEHGHH